jgi:hypothetical protein
VVNVPLVSVIVVLLEKASCKVHVAVETALGPKESKDVIDLPFDVIVYEPELAGNVIVDICVQVIPDARVKLPLTLTLFEPANVPVYPVKFKLRQLPVAVTVTVPAPELESKNTSSADVGTLAPPVPPELADQFVVVVVSQLPVPPTQ